MTAYTLVIVDMQPCFSAANDRATLQAIKKEIRRAKELGMPIVALEIDCFSPLQERLPRTHKRLLELLVGYPRYRMEEKRFNDGSNAVLWALEVLGCDEEGRNLRVCGVNTDACVLDTVLGLAKRLPKSRINVLKDACNTSGNKNCWARFTPPNVFVVSNRKQ
ncbi:MAG: isochorismatase family protein [Cyanobacteria bacterium]|nr:isochorismatase family protein [Cyanobacteriota bacterium]